jgi:hypothetical protein
MNIRMKLTALAVAASAASLVLAGGPASASTSTQSVHPAWFTGLEVIHGQLHGRAAFVQASKNNPRLPVRFRGVVRTHGVVGLGSSKSKTHSIRTPVGRFTVRGISQHTRARILSRASCRLQITVTSRLVMRPRKSTGVFRDATGRGVVRVRFTFNYRRHHNGTCNFGNNAVPKKHGGLISFRLVMPRLTVR